MITINGDRHVIVQIDNARYDLSFAEQYSNFLLLVTSPDEDTPISLADFEIDPELDDSVRPIAERYSNFLTEFIKRREKKLGELKQDIPSEEREKAINDFIQRLREAPKAIAK